MKQCSWALILLLSLSMRGMGAEKVDWVIHARYILTMDPEHRIIENGAIAIKDGHIAAVDKQRVVDADFTSDNILEKSNSLLAPGLIDTHTHAPMVLLRGIADDRKLEDWLHNYIFPAEARNVSPDFVRWGTRLACLEMLLAGITTYTDMYYFEENEAQAAKEIGIRAVLGQTIIGFPAPDYKTWQEAIAGTERFLKRYQHDDLIVPAVAPHAIYTTPDSALVASHKLASQYGAPLLIHLAETSTERDEAMSKRAQTPTQVLENLGLLEGRVVAAHSIWEDDRDLQILRRHNTGVAHCPSSNMKLADGVAHISQMLKLGIHVGLGTDGFAGSNDSADLMREMDIAAKLQKITQLDPSALPAEQVLDMATIGGARVLGLDRETGSLEKGKRADLFSLSLTSTHAKPLYDLYSFVVYAARSNEVEDVFVNGRELIRNREPLTIDQGTVFQKAMQYQQQIQASLKH